MAQARRRSLVGAEQPRGQAIDMDALELPASESAGAAAPPTDAVATTTEAGGLAASHASAGSGSPGGKESGNFLDRLEAAERRDAEALRDVHVAQLV